MDEIRFREIFAHAPISIWEEDFSAVGEWLDSLRERGVEDLEAFLASEPEELRRAVSLVRLVEVNEVTLRMWEVDSLEELLERWTDLFTEDTFEAFAGELLAIWEGRNEVTFQCSARTATGRPIHYEMHWVAPTVGGEMNLRQVIVAIVDVTERRRAEEKLRRNADLAGRLSRRLIEVQERERLHLARELHDEFGQLLSAMRLHVSVAQNETGAAAESELSECVDLLDRAAKQVRNLALELRPVMLDDFGLDATLRWLADEYQKRTKIETVVTGGLNGVCDAVAVSCYRVVQEALTNVTRHARAEHVSIEMAEEARQLRIVVRDDGVGFDVNGSHKRDSEPIHLGLLGMAERIEGHGGELRVTSTAGDGTSVEIVVPLAEAS